LIPDSSRRAGAGWTWNNPEPQPTLVFIQETLMSDTRPPRGKERPTPGTQARNPFAAPTAHVEDVRAPINETLADDPNKVAAGRGFAWWSEGWRIFREAPGLWIGIGVTLMIINILVGLVPVVGDLATSLIFPVFGAGLMLGCRAIDAGEELRFGHLFAGFQDKLGRLLMIGVLVLLGSVVIIAIAFAFGVGTSVFFGGTQTGASDMNLFTLLLVLGIVLVGLLAIMAIWFAPALVALHELTAFEAMKLSFRGCLRNWLPFLAYGLAFIGIAILASLPLGLGWLALMPLIYCSTYAAYRDIFTTGFQ
jgi:hypothetical protein